MDTEVSDGLVAEPAVMPARPLVVSLVVATAIAVVAGVVVGYPMSWAVADPNDDWSGLAAGIFGVGTGVVVGVTVFVIGTVWCVRRSVPEGRRARTGVVFVVVTLAFAITGPVALVASIPAAVLAAGLARRPWRWWPWLAVPAVVVGAALVLQEVVDRRRVDRATSAVDLATFGGTDLDVAGLDLASDSRFIGRPTTVRLRWEDPDRPGDSVYLELTGEPRRVCDDRFGIERCEVVALTGDGREIWLESTGYGATAWVDTPRGSWVVEVPVRDGRAVVDPVALVASLEPVDRDAFERAVDAAG